MSGNRIHKTEKVAKKKKDDNRNRDNKFQRFWLFERNLCTASYLFLVYLFIFVYSAVSFWMLEYLDRLLQINIVVFFLAPACLSFIISSIDYRKKKNCVDGICFKVIEAYEMPEQYARFLEVKKCIITFGIGRKNYDVKTNINVVEAAIEHDQAYSVVLPVFLTVMTALFIEKEMDLLGLPLLCFVGAMLLLCCRELLYIIPRNAFIKKVLDNIREEIK